MTSGLFQFSTSSPVSGIFRDLVYAYINIYWHACIHIQTHGDFLGHERKEVREDGTALRDKAT